MLGNTGNDLLFKVTAKQQEGRCISLFYLLQAFFIIICCLAAVWLLQLGSIVHTTSIQFGLPIGVGTYAIYMLVLKSLVNGEVSTNITIFRLNFVVSSVLAVVFLNEILTARKVIGRSSAVPLSSFCFYQLRGPARDLILACGSVFQPVFWQEG